MFQSNARTLGRLLKNVFYPFTSTPAHDSHLARVEPTLSPHRDSAFAARCERRLEEALTATSRVR